MLFTGGFTYSSAGGDLYEDEGDRSNTIQFNPSASYFLIPNLAIGGKILYSRSSQGDYSNSQLAIGPHILYFFNLNSPQTTVKGSVYPYIGGGVYYTGLNYKYDSDDSDDYNYDYKYTGTIISFGGGGLYMLSNTVGLFAEGSYQIDNIKPEDGDSESGNKFNIVAGISFFLY